MADDSTTGVLSQGPCLSETSSRSLTASVAAAHNFEVTNFSLLEGMGVGEFISSSTFSVGCGDWNIRLFPDGCEANDKGSWIRVSLHLFRGAVGVKKVKYSFSFRGNEDQEELLIQYAYTIFDQINSRGWPKYFVNKSLLESLLQLSNDKFIIRCVVTVMKHPHTEDASNIVVVPQSDVLQHFERMLRDGIGTDVTFSVHGQSFHAHRCVLSARSPVFEAELLGPMRKKPAQHMEIDDMEPSIFEAVLHFIYTDSLPVNPRASTLDTAMMQHLLVAAGRFGLERLRLVCEAELCRGMDAQTVATALALAEQHHCAQLKNACLGFIASPDVLPAVMKTDGYKHLVRSCQFVVQEILDKIAAVETE